MRTVPITRNLSPITEPGGGVHLQQTEEEVGDLKANLCLVAEQIEGAWKDAYRIRLERSHTSKRLCIAFRHIESLQ